jgi:hypothetical protein
MPLKQKIPTGVPLRLARPRRRGRNRLRVHRESGPPSPCLVKDQQVWIVNECAAQSELLLYAARQLAGGAERL